MRLGRRSLLSSLPVLAAPGTCRAAAQTNEPLRIATIETLSGPGSGVNRLYSIGTRQGVAMLNAAGGFNGRPIEFREYDAQGTTSVAAERFRAAAADGIHIFVHGGSSAIAGQLIEDLRRHNMRNPARRMIFLNTGAEALELTGEKCNAFHFRLTTNAEIRVRALVAAMRAQGALGSRVVSINQNYSWGRDMEGAITAAAAAGGYEVVERILHDTNRIQDFSPFAARIAAARPSAVITGNWGNDLALLLRAVSAAGLRISFGTCFLDLPGSLSAAGDAAVGYYQAEVFNPIAFGAEGETMMEEYRARAGTFPSTSEVKAVLSMQFLGKALASLPPGTGPDTTRIAAALVAAQLRLPIGEMAIRAEDRQLIQPLVVSHVVKGSRYPIDGTDMGFEPVGVVPGPEAVNPVQASCRLERPA
ncbi:ABC transporter substrate-binding protein [Siccirubricoccus sp. KC 17139]|uniref:ABC transporter substrate-binding protein n=1 Tax=Siccirubricoccus soli TaxID=2899147 RepID=A0ABT1D5S1_9PROT|nr:ABC transporter substrate-binding protein [Siccirubricoccus soli]MCO6416564.1 ABC transporter substrate-binding protein [Siccirubricoccus soli]MCP2682699.1 ABC transporter substrate-binding protein [Siccirubricoccus soli]